MTPRVEAIDYVFENVTRNRGVSAAVFDNGGAALQWLLSATTKSWTVAPQTVRPNRRYPADAQSSLAVVFESMSVIVIFW